MNNMRVAALFAAAFLAVVPLQTCAAEPVGVKPLRWILNGPVLSTLASDPDAQAFFGNAEPFVMQRRNNTVAVPASWRAVPLRSFTSYAAMKKAFENGAVGPEVRAIMYDNEAWSFTPIEEQKDVASYTRMAAQLVHEHGLMLVTAPAVDLVRILAPGPGKRYDKFLSLGVARDSAKYSDVIDIQAQGSEANVKLYRNFVAAAAKQAREANPSVIVLAGISTNPSGHKVTADMVYEAIKATRSLVDGYWLNVPAPSEYCPKCSEFRPDMALELIRRLEKP